MKAWKVAVTTLGATVLAGATAAFLVAPSKPEKWRMDPFYGKYIAHRGLHNGDKDTPENSMAAFKAAAEAGYGVEIDVRLTADNKVVVFHDVDLRRACGVNKRVEEMTYFELRELRLFDTDEQIPLLRDALSAIAGRGPVIVELKHGLQNKKLCASTLEIIRSYFGPVCIESFDPFIVSWFKKNAPDLLRGQLTGSVERMRKETTFFNAFMAGHMLVNFISRPHFIAHDICKKSIFVKYAEAFGAMKAAWVAYDRGGEMENDAIIFEGFSPPRRYK